MAAAAEQPATCDAAHGFQPASKWWLLRLVTSCMTWAVAACSTAQHDPLQNQQQQCSLSQVVVVERPGLRHFVQSVSQAADVCIFTAGAKEYAQPIIQALDPDGSLFGGRVFYREHTVPVKCRSHGADGLSYIQSVKDLVVLRRDLSRVILLDNKPHSFLLQPSNGIPCVPYYGDPHDCHLSTVVLPLIQSLVMCNDVRPILEARFKMTTYLFPILSHVPLARWHG